MSSATPGVPPMKRSLFAAVAVLAMSSPAAMADAWLLQLDDSTETMFSYVYDNGVLNQAPGNCGTGENCSQAAGFNVSPSDQTANFSTTFDLFEPDGTTLSDFGTASAFFVPNGNLQDFALSLNSSNGSGPFSGPPAQESFIETGGWQTVATGNVYNVDHTLIDTITFQVRSSLDDVPEPLTLSLVGAGLAGVAAARRRRKASRAV